MKTLDSATPVGLESSRFDSAGLYAFPHVAIIKKPDSLCHVFENRIGLDSSED